EPNPSLPGQTVTITFPAGTVRARIAGGGFGQGKFVSGTARPSDSPKQTTQYLADLWFADTAAPSRRTITVEVCSGTFPALATYRHASGWKVDYLKGWKVFGDPTPGPDGGFVLFFAPIDECIERVGVAFVKSE